MRVLYLIPTLERGGAETDVVRLATQLGHSFEVTVYPFLGLGPLANSLPPEHIILPTQVEGAKINDHGVRRSLKTKANALRALAFYPRQLSSFDIVHAVLPNSYLLAGLLRCLRVQLRPAKLVMTRCGLNWHQNERLYWFGERVLHKTLLCHAIANCNAIARELAIEGVDENRITVIPNGIDVDAWRRNLITQASAKIRLGIPPDTFTITCIGNLWRERKGHGDLLAAMKIADLKCPWVLLLVGRDEGGYRAELERVAFGMGIADRVRFLGTRDDINLVLSAADLHVSASHTEGLPNNILEAMTAGVAVVATNVGGTSDLVQHGVTGELVPPRNPPVLAAAIHFLSADRKSRDRLGFNGLERASRHFSLQAFLDAHTSLYREVMDRPAPKSALQR